MYCVSPAKDWCNDKYYRCERAPLPYPLRIQEDFLWYICKRIVSKIKFKVLYMKVLKKDRIYFLGIFNFIQHFNAVNPLDKLLLVIIIYIPCTYLCHILCQIFYPLWLLSKCYVNNYITILIRLICLKGYILLYSMSHETGPGEEQKKQSKKVLKYKNLVQ